MRPESIESIDSVNYECPLGKSDHVLVEVLMTEDYNCSRDESHKIGRLNYRKADYEAMKQYFSQMDWGAFDMAENIDEKWDWFLKTYNDCVKKYVPRVRARKVESGDWFGRRCMEARNN